ncbi:hypothetical protein HCK74_004429 [Salmonella enterica]|jgi:hypothetical protein|uniref:hypothetical protein n=1 Tax=Citrobacter freundii complex TaxID=1344959 RepID=UPI001271B01A|nr:hypothetical protein [Citrobacter cronae]EAV1590961.1 hypothetical protein [Salmonella enterica]EBQ9479057.1 hypothetical protein [Salmonella enterica subsp. enterica serovar Kokomlemle]EDB5955448.1 hypothetical protein [Salmonella enterica subsp. enterica serovar Bareilly]EDV2729422.1 hypothetical protein [Salmonella enterica subsp. enterica serovar Poona]EDX4491620.1 hypothetical protein [Salmonella enterica subsp. salamae]
MSNFNEIDPLLTLELSGVKTYASQEEVWWARLYEWLNTPVGQVYGNPSWGNILPEFKHEPTNQSHIQIAIEARLFSKLRIDLPDVPASGLMVREGSEIDKLVIAIQIHDTVITQEVKL